MLQPNLHDKNKAFTNGTSDIKITLFLVIVYSSSAIFTPGSSAVNASTPTSLLSPFAFAVGVFTFLSSALAEVEATPLTKRVAAKCSAPYNYPNISNLELDKKIGMFTIHDTEQFDWIPLLKRKSELEWQCRRWRQTTQPRIELHMR
jgi:hypothetical protein